MTDAATWNTADILHRLATQGDRNDRAALVVDLEVELTRRLGLDGAAEALRFEREACDREYFESLRAA